MKDNVFFFGIEEASNTINNFTDAYCSERRHMNWNDRIPKAAFFVA